MNHDGNVNGGLEEGRVLTKGRSGLGVFPSWIWLFATWLAAPLSASPQHLRPIEASDRVFEALERLQAFGVLDTIPIGQRSGLERAVRKALRGGSDSAAGRTVEQSGETVASAAAGPSALIGELERLVEHPAFAADLELSYAWADVRARAVPDNGLGGIAATTVRLAEQRGGRVLEDGSNWTVEPGFHWRSGDWSGVLRGRVRWLQGEGSDPAEGRIQEVWAEGPLGPLYLTIGRAPAAWGVSPSGGHMHSGHARALDQVTVASDGTFRFPWIFRYIGPTRLSLTVARLEGARAIPHSFIVSYKISYKPMSSLELGVAVLNHSGGEGAPEASFGRRLLDYLVLPERFTSDPDLEISNLFAGFDVRWRLPGTRGSQAYGAMTIDDFGFNKELGRVFKQDASYLLGFTIPRLAEDGSVGLRVEYRQTGIRFYRHGQFTSGLTFDGVVIGDPLGPDGRGGYLAVDARPNRWDRITFQVAREERSGDYYVSEREADGFMRFTKVDDLPEEMRTRIEVSWERTWPTALLGGTTTLVRAAYERVSDFDFEAGVAENGAMLELRVTMGTARSR